MKIDEIDKQIIYYYRNNFAQKTMCEKTGLRIGQLQGRITKLRKQGLLKRWWQE